MKCLEDLLAKFKCIEKAVHHYIKPPHNNITLPQHVGYIIDIPSLKSYRPSPSPYIPPFH